MNKSLSNSKRMVEEPIAYEKAVKHEVVSKTKTLSGLISGRSAKRLWNKP